MLDVLRDIFERAILHWDVGLVYIGAAVSVYVVTVYETPEGGE